MEGIGIIALIIRFFIDLFNGAKTRYKDRQLRLRAIQNGEEWYKDIDGKTLTINNEPFRITYLTDNNITAGNRKGDRVWLNTINGHVIKNLTEEERRRSRATGGRFYTEDPLNDRGQTYWETVDDRRVQCMIARRNGKKTEYDGYHVIDRKTQRKYALRPAKYHSYIYTLINIKTGLYAYIIARHTDVQNETDDFDAVFKEVLEKCIKENEKVIKYNHCINGINDNLCWPREKLELSKIDFVYNILTKKVEKQ